MGIIGKHADMTAGVAATSFLEYREKYGILKSVFLIECSLFDFEIRILKHGSDFEF